MKSADTDYTMGYGRLPLSEVDHHFATVRISLCFGVDSRVDHGIGMPIYPPPAGLFSAYLAFPDVCSIGSTNSTKLLHQFLYPEVFSACIELVKPLHSTYYNQHICHALHRSAAYRKTGSRRGT